ncbi:MAG TPA: Gldg family protein, partial [Chitinophaga sp.]
MKLIFKIARTELRNLFYSPIAWFLTIVFLVQCAITYINRLSIFAINQEMSTAFQNTFSLTTNIFTDQFALFGGVMQNLYLYIPLLTMGLISREINTGTIKLLYSSPVKVSEIVLGKYLAMMILSLLLVAIVGIFMVAGVFHIRSVDYGVLLSAALGFYLLLCAYSAIGLFMSCLSNYQVVAAISTFIMIGILSYIGQMWQGIDFIRDLTYFLSLSGRTQYMLSGLITTKDVIYFLVIIYIFLGFTIFKLKSARESRSVVVKTGRYMIIVVTALLIGYITSRPSLTLYWDTTANKDNTLTPNTQQILHEFDHSPLEITVYNNFLDDHSYWGSPEQRNVFLGKWEPYLRFKPDIVFHFVNYYDSAYGNRYAMPGFYKGKTLRQIVEERAKAEDVDLSIYKTPGEIHKLIDLKPELNRFVMQLKYKGHTTFLRVFNDPMAWPGETETAAAFKRLLQARMPKIIFVKGDEERSTVKKGERDYYALTGDKTFRYALLNQGFDMDTLSLDTQEIPRDITALVVADPQYRLSAAALHKVQQYIAGGGNLVIAGEPGRQQLLHPLLKTLGVQMLNGMLEQKSEDYSPTLVLPHLTQDAIGLSAMLNKPSVYTHPVSTNGVAGLAYADTAGFHVMPLLVTDTGKARNTMARNPDLDIVE